MTTLYTEDQMCLIHDRLNNARTMVQWARCGSERKQELIDSAHKILAELAEALKDGYVELEQDEATEEVYTRG